MPTKLLDLEPQRRDAIINAALKEFVSKGFDGASTNVIAKEAGISKALMFHYVNNKHELFLCLYDYFAALLDKAYFSRIDFTEKDIFNRLRQSYLLQIELLKQYPWIFEFKKLYISANSIELYREMEQRSTNKQATCYPQILDAIDVTKFRSGLDVDWERIGRPAYRVSLPQYLLVGVPLNEYYCWGQEIYAPCDGIIVQTEDGYEERERTNLRLDLVNAYQNAHDFDPAKDDVQSVAGNYIIMECSENVYAALCHLQTGSVQVAVGQRVKQGDVIGRVGHSGNSFAPHLHFQLMDSIDIATANGLPCAFARYEVFQDGEWQEVFNCIPTNQDRIRFNSNL